VTIADLYASYIDWAKESGEPPLTKRDFGQRLDERGFPPIRQGKDRTRIRQGLRLRTPMDPDSADASADARTSTDANSYNFSLDDSSRETLQNERPPASVASASEPSWITEPAE
jgi:phage/plasmid-associated DNA primase